MERVYGKWDSPELNKEAFDKVASGEWSFDRFEAWVSQVCVEEYRNATSNEDM